MEEASYLLKQAERCRRLAAQLGPPNGDALLEMAQEYETRAGELALDALQPPVQTMIIPDC
jgi:hypothetical protein